MRPCMYERFLGHCDISCLYVWLKVYNRCERSYMHAFQVTLTLIILVMTGVHSYVEGQGLFSKILGILVSSACS